MIYDATIYSKNVCMFCNRAKELLTDKGYKYKERNISDPEIRQELLTRVPDAKTVPQIYIGLEYIGGFNELEKYFEERQ